VASLEGLRTRAVTVIATVGLVAAMVALTSGTASAATGHLYWAETNDGAIGRANMDGSSPNSSFITGLNCQPSGIAVDTSHIYWADMCGAVGRANLDGTHVDEHFITGLCGPRALAVDQDHLYWANYCTRAIGRANLDGSGVDDGFIGGLCSPFGVAVNDAHLYWADLCGSIGRANLDGSNAEAGFISGLCEPASLSVDAKHIFWGDPCTAAIGSAALDGSNPNADLVTGISCPFGVDADNGRLLWGDYCGGLLGTARLDGSSPHQFIGGLSSPWGVAVDPTPPDTFAPSVKITLPDPDGANGWFVSGPVAGSVSVNDTATGGSAITSIDCTSAVNGASAHLLSLKETGIGTPTASGDFSVSDQGVTTISCTATDAASNTSGAQTATVNLDTVAPIVALTGATDGAVYPLSAPPTPVCRAADSAPGSGLRANSNLALSPLGGGVGSFTATCSGVLDRAGNAAASVGVHYTVGYGFGRFMPPLPRPAPVQAGSTVPVKFSLEGAAGPLDTATSSSLARNNQVRVALFGQASGTVLATASCNWDPSNAGFQCNLKTPKGLASGDYILTAQETLTPNGSADTFFKAPGAGNGATLTFK
jgi:hypothetical protein